MSSATSPVKETLEGYLAGRVKADQVAAVVSAAFYTDGRGGTRDALRPVVDVIERLAPGVVSLTGRSDGPGFDLHLAERPFPPRHEPDLRRAVEAALTALPAKRGALALLLRTVGRWMRFGDSAAK